MSVWLAIPSKRPPEQVEPTLKLWRDKGYKIALWVDGPAYMTEWGEHGVDLRVMQGEKYPGYAVACNTLIGLIIQERPNAEWFICAGDDTEPDQNHSAGEIAFQCGRHFGEQQKQFRMEAVVCDMAVEQPSARMEWSTFGVMQPTGDRWGEHDIKGGHLFEKWPDHPHRCIHCGQGQDAPRHMVGAYIDRVCGSPWIGREFARRMYGGNGPYWPEYTHMGVDEELQEVAIKMGVLWQRRDLTHYHNHWGRPRGGEKYGNTANMPEFLQHANSGPEWDRYKRILAARRASGFPGHEPIACGA